MTRTTIDDVASAAGVSIKTVSRVVNREPNVSEKTRNKVMEVVKNLDYRPNVAARSLASKRSYFIGLLYDNPSPNYVIDVQQGVLNRCEAAGFNLMIHPCDSRNENFKIDTLAMLKRSHVDGVILTSPLAELDEINELLAEQSIPCVRIGLSESYGEFSGVYCDDRHAAFEMTQYLINAGHRRIGFVKGLVTHNSTEERFEGYKAALEQNGLVIEEELLVRGEFNFTSGTACGKQLLTLSNPPTAIFASNDDMATGIMVAAHHLGLSIPEDISVVGFDDSPLASQVYPALTTVRQPIRDMAEQATDLLLSQVSNKSGNKATEDVPIKFTCDLKMRDSVASVKINQPE